MIGSVIIEKLLAYIVLIRRCVPLCNAYEALIREVIAPHLLRHYPDESVVLYQFPVKSRSNVNN